MTAPTITLSRGYPEEKQITLSRPKGSNARQKMAEVLAFSKKVQQIRKEVDDLNGSGDDQSEDMIAEKMLQVIEILWNEPDFESVILPFVLDMESEEDRKYLQEEGTPVEILAAFYVASQWKLEQAYGGNATQQALGKSAEEAQEAQPKKRKRKTT